MAVFTAIATALVGAIATSGTILGSVVLFNTAVGIVATGLAVGTAKLLGVFEAPKLPNRADPGVKIQIPPATDNKVPKMYGQNFTGGIIIDAEIKNENQSMAYALVISEYADGETWSVDDIFRGDGKLSFGTGGQAHIVKSITDTNNGSSSTIADKMSIRVYAGGSEGSNQIFPAPGGAVPQVAAYNYFDSWTSDNTMEGLVFAIVEIDYDVEAGTTGLGAITFKLENSVHNPADVLEDYLTNERYGAGINISSVDTDSLDDLRSFSNAQVSYSVEGTPAGTHERYRIDGALSTFDTVKDNIDKICRNAGCFFSYSAKQGKFAVVSNRAATAGEKANAFVLNDDNIIDSIQITSQELYNIFNSVEVEYPSFIKKDQTDTVFLEIPSGDRNPNEPDNTLNYRLDMTNNRARVTNLATVDLVQSRYNTVLTLTADYGAMTVEVGEVVKVTQPLYGFDNKLFRVMRSTEKESADGALSVELVLLEYDDDVYDHIEADIDNELGPSNIDGIFTINAGASIEIGNVALVDDLQGNASIIDFDTGNVIASDTISNVRSNSVVQRGIGSFISVPVTLQTGRFDSAIMTLRNANNSVDEIDVSQQILPPYSRSTFENQKILHLTLPLDEFSDDNPPLPLEVSVQFLDQVSRVASPVFTSGNIDVDVKNIVTTNLLANGSVTGDIVAIETINTENIANAAIEAVKIAEQAVVSGKLAANAVSGGNIVDLAITETKIANDSISTPKIQTNAITANEIAAGTITANEIAASTITGAKIAAGTIQATNIAAGTITASQIATGTITANEIAASTITGDKIAANQITAAKIAAGTITANEIAASTITGDKIAASNIITASAQIGDAIITNAKIADLAVDTLKIQNNAVTVPASESMTSAVALTTTFKGGADGLPDPTVVLSVTANVLVTFAVQFNGGSNYEVQIKRGGSVIFGPVTTGSVSISSPFFISFSFVDSSVGSGSHTYEMEVRSATTSFSPQAIRATLSAVASKR